VREAAWPAFLAGAGIDPAEPGLPERVRVLQVLRMMEQLATGYLVPASPASSPTGCMRH
jgi:hypothetical protein